MYKGAVECLLMWCFVLWILLESLICNFNRYFKWMCFLWFFIVTFPCACLPLSPLQKAQPAAWRPPATILDIIVVPDSPSPSLAKRGNLDITRTNLISWILDPCSPWMGSLGSWTCCPKDHSEACVSSCTMDLGLVEVACKQLVLPSGWCRRET